MPSQTHATGIGFAAVLIAILSGTSAGAAEWYASPQGTPQARGTRQSPWDLASALLGKHAIQPGDTLYLRAGTYRRRPSENFSVRLAGVGDRPIIVRPAPGEHAVIDGGLAVENPSAHLWIWDLEILVSEPQPTRPVSAGSHPGDFKRPWGGLHLHGGSRCKFVNLVIHDCRQGVSAWSGAKDCELHGCVIYDNGWKAVDRGHGHAIYTQNQDGTKTISDCIMTGGHGYTMHAYGSKNAYVDNFRIEGNIAYQAGPFLIGGGRPSRHVEVIGNYLYGVPLQVGYSARYNEDCVVRDNVVVNAGLSINKYRKAVNEGNLVLAKGAPRPKEGRVVLRPNKYDRRRAHLVLFNWQKKAEMAVDPAGFLKKGEAYRLLDPRALFGKPVQAGRYDGSPIRVRTPGELAVFVLLKGA